MSSKCSMKSLNQVIIRARASVTLAHQLHFFLPSHPFSSSSPSPSSSSPKPIECCLDRNSFTVDFLLNSCGLTLERAISVSKRLSFRVSDKPNSVLAFFEDQGFTHAQISKLISCYPRVLVCDPKKTLFPKVEFFKSKGISGSDIATIITRWPEILNRSIEHQLIPSFNFFGNLLLSNERKNITAFKRCAGVLLLDLEKHGKANSEILKKAGVPLKNVGFLLASHPRVLMTNCNKFQQIVDEVTKMDFDPLKFTFVEAVYALRSMTKSTWNRKLEVYKKCGWSEKDIDSAFRYHPRIMTLSEEKITSVMEFWINRMGFESSFLATVPTIILLSLQNRVVPRCEVYQALLSKGFKKPCGVSLLTFLTIPESSFLRKITDRHEEEAPDLLKLYNEKLTLGSN